MFNWENSMKTSLKKKAQESIIFFETHKKESHFIKVRHAYILSYLYQTV